MPLMPADGEIRGDDAQERLNAKGAKVLAKVREGFSQLAYPVLMPSFAFFTKIRGRSSLIQSALEVGALQIAHPFTDELGRETLAQ